MDLRSKPPAPTRLDRAIAAVFPQYGLRRYMARRALALQGGYSGARRDRSGTQNWKPGGGSADADLLGDLAELRERSRDLVRNNPLARGAIRTNVTSVVGPGLKLKSQIDRAVLKLSDTEADAWENRAEQLFRFWCRANECDLTGVQDFDALQGLVFRAVLESGDCLAALRMRQGNGRVFETTLDVIEADRLSNPSNKADSIKLAGGVEIDDAGRPTRYHICNRHPGDAVLGSVSSEWQAYAARADDGSPLILHIFERARIGQRRGEPYLAPVVEALKQLSNYAEAELDAAVMSACFAVFVKSAAPAVLPQNSTNANTTSASDFYKDVDIQKATLVTMREGDDISTATPGRPNENFDPFFLSVCRQIGVALELPYEILIKHFTASYAAARAALLEAWRAFRARRAWLVSTFCQPSYEAVLAEAVARGLIAAPGFFGDPLVRAAWCGAAWIGPAPGQIDPVKETDAAIKKIEATLSTYSKETAAISGDDWERQFPQRRREEAMVRGAGMRGASTSQASPADPAATPPDPTPGATQGDDA